MIQIRNQYDPLPSLAVPLPIKVPYGIVLSITPTDNTYGVEVWRAPDDGTGNPDTGNMAAVDSRLYAAHGDVFVDQLPNDNAKRFYRWRHVVSGGTAGSYTAWVWARPAFMPQTYAQPKTLVVPLRSMPLADGQTNLASQDATGQTAAADVYVPNTNTVKVGTAASPSSITKTLRFSHANMIPFDNATKWTQLDVYLHPNSLDTSQSYIGLLPMPKGVTITAFRARMFVNNGSCTATAYLKQCANEVVSTLATLNDTTLGSYTTLSASLSQLVGSEEYLVDVTLIGHLSADNARFVWAEVDYTMPSYDKGY